MSPSLKGYVFVSETRLDSNCPNVSKKFIHFQKRVGGFFSIPLKKGVHLCCIFLAALIPAAVVFCLQKLMCAAVYWWCSADLYAVRCVYDNSAFS